MKSQRVTVIDGSLPAGSFQGAGMEPNLITEPEFLPVLHELMQREPLLHRPEFGCMRKDWEKMIAPDFWEVGASGRRYSRQFVLDTLEKKLENPVEQVWELDDFYCQKISADNYLATYTLIQGKRVTRRCTLWRRTKEGWQVLYHQGTIVTDN